MSDFLGSGWKFPIAVDRDGKVASAQGENLIEDSIHIILGTTPGERVMRPDFGCKIRELVFAVNNKATHNLIVLYISQALQRWEPRIDVTAIEVFSDALQQNKINVHIDYKIKTTNTKKNLVYPFYLLENQF